MAELYIVATPIGNLKDITLRAIEVLQNADVIAAEDTRHTIGLLNHYGISKKLISYHEHSDEKKIRQIIDLIKNGKSVALVSDAGTPVVSDPGLPLIDLALEEGIKVIPIPGACAAVTAFSASGIKSGKFVFYGFLDAKQSERKRELEKIKNFNMPVILYESPHRLVRTLEDISQVCGKETLITVARELTKVHEEFVRGSADELLKSFGERENVKGEFVLIIECIKQEIKITDEYIMGKIQEYTKQGYSTKDAVKNTAKELGIPKNRVYEIATK